MIVPKKLKAVWDKKIQHGDVVKIAENYKLNARSLYRIIKEGRGQQATVDCINHFLLTRKKETNKIVKELEDDGN